MRKKLVIAALLTSILGASIGFGAFAATKFTLIVNGKVANVEPIVQKGVTYVPLRAAAELLGADVGFNNATKTVTVQAKGSEAVDSYNAGEFVFTQLQADDGSYGWETSVEIANTSAKNYKGVNFTAVFYDGAGKRVGSAFGSVSDIDAGAQMFSRMVTMDDLTGWKTVKFQIDIKI